MTTSIAKCVAVAGSSNAGIVLYKLSYWMDKTKIERGGYPWTVLSRERWCEETGLSRNAFDRAISGLKQEDLIVSERHLLGNKVRAFLRLSQRAVLRLGENVHFLKSENTGVLGDEKTGVLKTEKTLKDKELEKGTKLKSSGSFPPAHEIDLVQGVPEKDMKVSEVVNMRKAKKGTKQTRFNEKP